MGKKVVSVVGGCSTKKSKVGFQFSNELGTTNYDLGGSFIVGGGGDGTAETLSGTFRAGQSFKTVGCRLCGHKFVYQCCHCDKFICYDGNAQANAVCPLCGKTGNVPKTTDDRIVRSSAARKIQIIMAIDLSGSMRGARLAEVKIAAINDFVNSFPSAEIALVTFGDEIVTVMDFTTNHALLKVRIQNLSAFGGTYSPFAHIMRYFADFCSGADDNTDRYVVVFTDGAWANPKEANRDSATLRQNGVVVIAIGCAGAKQESLEQMATPGASIVATEGSFGSAFATAAKKISQ